jgi:SsrA-binding protein
VAERTVATNRKARHEYHIVESLEAGLVLTGSEIKSVRAGKVSLQQAYAQIRSGEAWLVGAHIAEYEFAGYASHEPTRRRKLLLHAREIDRLESAMQRQGATVVPLRLYLKDGWAKVELGLAKGKTRSDKREAIKERDVQRDIDRELAVRGRGR